MVKKLTLMKQRKRASIQLLHIQYPNYSNVQIAKMIKVSSMTVAKWKNQDTIIDKKRRRKTKMNRKIKNFLIRKTKNKFTGINKASSRKLAREIEKVFNLNISYRTVTNWLNRVLKKPIKAKKTFLLRERDKKRRIEFAQMINDKKISGKNIFFTDEKRFLLNPPLNRQTNQIRTDEKSFKEFKSGKGPIFEKISRPIPKFPNGNYLENSLTK